MTRDDPHWNAFLELYGGLPRQGPGSAAATRAVLALVPDLPDAPRVVDAGCGSGASTLVLAEALPRARILAVDVLDMLLERLRAALSRAGLADRVDVRNQSMDAVELRGVDLVWSEGAAYEVGTEGALRHWAEVVRPGGSVVFSEACWFGPESERPAELRAYWGEAYPAMRDEAGVLALAESLGAYQPVATRRLEREVWIESFYGPLKRRCAEMRPGAAVVMTEVIAEAEREVGMFERYGDLYGYTFFVLQRR